MHAHSFDQTLYILDGEGIVATQTTEERVHPGDVVVVPAGEPNWHGATGKTAMTQLAFGVPGTTDVVAGALRAAGLGPAATRAGARGRGAALARPGPRTRHALPSRPCAASDAQPQAGCAPGAHRRHAV